MIHAKLSSLRNEYEIRLNKAESMSDINHLEALLQKVYTELNKVNQECYTTERTSKVNGIKNGITYSWDFPSCQVE